MSVNNPRFPHTCVITRAAVSDDPMNDEGEAVVIYEGECRAYSKNTTSVEGEVITNNRGLSLPVSKDEWSKDSIPMEGDKIEIDFGSYTEHGQVIDKIAANFHGTHLVWRYVKG